MEDEYNDLDKLECDYHKAHEDNGGSSEFDHSINTISQERIKRFLEEHKKGYIGSYNGAKQKVELKEITPGVRVLSFECDFIIANEDDELIELINSYRNSHYYDNDIMKKIVAIEFRIEQLGGQEVSWS